MPVRVDDSKNIIVVTFAGSLAEGMKGSTTKEVNTAISRTKIKNIVFHLDNCLSTEESVLFEMAEIIKSVSRQNGSARLVGVNQKIYRQLKETCLDRILLMRSDLKSATVDMGYNLSDADLEHLDGLINEHVNEMKDELKDMSQELTEEQKKEKQEKAKEEKKQVDVQFINQFLKAATNVLETQFAMEAKPMKPYPKKPTDPLLLGDICGLISIDSKYFKGTLSISFSESLFIELAKSIFEEDEIEIDEDVIDLASEIANMVLGDAKANLAKEGYKVKSALPHHLWNKNSSHKMDSKLCIVIPYATPFGNFYTEVLDDQDVMTILNKFGAAA